MSEATTTAGSAGPAAWATDVPLQAFFDLGAGEVEVTAGARGALGRVWRLSAGDRVLALKETFAGDPPGADRVDVEVRFTRRAAAAGVRVPASHPARDGRFVVPLPGGGWLRLYDWVDLRSADLPASTEALGVLLALLHRSAPMAHHELDGGPPGEWYSRPPALAEWEPLVRAAQGAGVAWAARLGDAVARLPELHAVVAPADPGSMRLCHRDLHPGNVLSDRAGDLVVVDWDDLGPASPAHELARTLVACYHDGEPDLGSIARAHRAYVDAGGPARLSCPDDFTMLVATQLNFLHHQVRVALDPATSPRDHDWAEAEIEESLRTMPTRELVDAVLASLA